MNNIEIILNAFKKKYADESLANLYLIRFNPNEFSFDELTSKVIEKLFSKQFQNHPDILKVTLDHDEKIYKVDSPNFAQLIQFLNFNPINLKHKFAFIADSHLISDTLYNKMLKTFEELDSKISVFLFAPKNEQILLTIKSRAIEISFNAPLSSHKSDQLRKISFEELKQHTSSFDEIIDYLKANQLSFEEYDALLNSIQILNEQEVFYSSRNTKLACLLP